MKDDPRSRNKTFDGSSVGAYLHDYAAGLKAALETVDIVQLEKARALIEATAASGNHIYAVGNGGSAAIADHLCCDWTKGTHHEKHPTLTAFSMSANVALYSAIANDYGFEKVFSTQVAFSGRKGDLLVAISSSGNSPNILNALETARGLGMKTIGLSGFSGGKLKASADIPLHIAADNYGVVEDAHQALMHVLAQYIAKKRDEDRGAGES